MSYVDAGYAVGLSVLFLYALSLVLRRRALGRRAELAVDAEDLVTPSGPGADEP